MRKKYTFHFTLIELLAVITILSILAVIGFGSYSYANRAAREAAAKSIFTQVEAALKNAKSEMGYYPSTSGDWHVIRTNINSRGEFCISFNTNTTPSTYNRLSKIFVKIADTELLNRYSVNGILCDPWGGTIYYRSGRNASGIAATRIAINKNSFDLLSPGVDGRYGINADTSPGNTWTIRDFKDVSGNDASGELACDDIVNF